MHGPLHHSLTHRTALDHLALEDNGTDDISVTVSNAQLQRS